MKWDKVYSISTLLTYGLTALLIAGVLILLYHVLIKKHGLKDGFSDTKTILIGIAVLLFAAGYFARDMEHKVFDKEDTINAVLQYSKIVLKSDTLSKDDQERFKDLYYSDATVDETKKLFKSGSKIISLTVYNALNDFSKFSSWGNWDTTFNFSPTTLKYAKQFDSFIGDDYGARFLTSFKSDIDKNEITLRTRIAKSFADTVSLSSMSTKMAAQRDSVNSIYRSFFSEDLKDE